MSSNIFCQQDLINTSSPISCGVNSFTVSTNTQCPTKIALLTFVLKNHLHYLVYELLSDKTSAYNV